MEAESLIVFWPASSGGLHLVDTFELKENLCAERKEENGLTPLCWQLFDHCWRVVVSSELLGDFNSLIPPSSVLGLRSFKAKLSFLVV